MILQLYFKLFIVFSKIEYSILVVVMQCYH